MGRWSVSGMFVLGGKWDLAVPRISFICVVIVALCRAFPLESAKQESRDVLRAERKLCTLPDDVCYGEFTPVLEMTCDFGSSPNTVVGPQITACTRPLPWYRAFQYYPYQFDLLPFSGPVTDNLGGFLAQSKCTRKNATVSTISNGSIAMVRSPTYNPAPGLPRCKQYQLSFWIKLDSEPVFSEIENEKYLLEVLAQYPTDTAPTRVLWGTETDYQELSVVGSWRIIRFTFAADQTFVLNFIAYHKDDCVRGVPTNAISIDFTEMATGVPCPPTTTTPTTTTTTTTTTPTTTSSTTTTTETTTSETTSISTELTTSAELTAETIAETTAETTTESSSESTESSTESTSTSPTTTETMEQTTITVETGTSTDADTPTAESTSDWTFEPTVSETVTEFASDETTSPDSTLSSISSEMTSESTPSETSFETTDEPDTSTFETTSETSSEISTDSASTDDVSQTTADPAEDSTVSSYETESSETTWESSTETSTDGTSDTAAGITDEFITSDSQTRSTETTWETSSEASTDDNTTTDEAPETTTDTTDESTASSFETVSPETTWETSSETNAYTTTDDSSETTHVITDESTSSSFETEATDQTTWEITSEISPDEPSETTSVITYESTTQTITPETTWETSPESTSEDTSETTSDSRETTTSQAESSTETTGETGSTLTVSEETAPFGSWETTAHTGTTSDDTTSPESQPTTADDSVASESTTETSTNATSSETTSKETTESESLSESEQTTSDTTLETSSADTTTTLETTATSETTSTTEITSTVTTTRPSTPSTPPVPRPPSCGPGGSFSVEDNSCKCNPGLIVEGNRCRCPLLQFYSGDRCREVPVLLRSTYTVVKTFVPELTDRKSPEFQIFSEAFRAELLRLLTWELLAANPVGPQVAEVDFEVLSLRNGSIVADVLLKVQTADAGRQETITNAWEQTELSQLNVGGVVETVSTSHIKEYFDRCQLFDNVQYCGYGATCKSSSDNKITECECAPGKNYRSESRSCLDPDPTSDDDVYLILYIVAGVSGGVVLIGALGFFVFRKRLRTRPNRPNHYTDPLESSISAFELPARTHWKFANRNQDDAESQYSDGFDPPVLSSGYASSSRRTSFSSARQSYRDYDADKKK